MEFALIVMSAVLGIYAGAVLLYQTYLYNFTDYLDRKDRGEDNEYNKRI